MRLMVITGLSGAGKSQALRLLEDLHYFCMDNLPCALLSKFIEIGEAAGVERAAIVIDVRAGADFEELFALLNAGRVPCEILFFEADEDVLLRRYKETRRTHPLQNGEQKLTDAIAKEKELMEPLRKLANRIIDTSDFTAKDLRGVLERIFVQDGAFGKMAVSVMSFGYKYGVPQEADLVFDARFINNPYYDPALRPLSGLDFPVKDYVLGQAISREFLQSYAGLIRRLLPYYRREDKSQMVIAIGCTGGRHRSVALAEALGRELSGVEDTVVSVTHRDIQNDTNH